MLNIDMEFKQGILLVRLIGELNKNTVKTFEKDIKSIITTNGIKYMLLNLKRISYMDELGIEAIKQSYSQITENNGKLIICGINKLLDQNKPITKNLYQVAEETTAYEIVKI